jgi:hypothetical protein
LQLLGLWREGAAHGVADRELFDPDIGVRASAHAEAGAAGGMGLAALIEAP